MNSMWANFFDVLKIVLPLLIFYFLFKRMIDKQQLTMSHLIHSKINEQRTGKQLSLRLQALERMSLYIERIDLQSMIYRLNQSNFNVQQLYLSMRIAMQEELEHNITQQIYLSDSLWKIVIAAREHQVKVLDELKSKLGDTQPSSDLTDLIARYQIAGSDALNLARRAIKEESKILL